MVFVLSTRLYAALPADESKLPSPAGKQIDFAQDIKPIFDASCIRCHGPVRPKSGFRLDNRSSALKGGDNGVDIIPGNSAKSPLVHFTGRLVPDMEMPPPDKGEPLTAVQIGLLRAWIDQGASWESAAPTNSQTVAFSGLLGGTTVSGNNQKFRELYWHREGPYGGLTDFQLTRLDNPDTTLTLFGHVLPEDYEAVLSLDRNELGFIHSGVEQYRKYYNDVGGYDPAVLPNAPSLNQDLYLTLGKAWIDFGLTLPNWPRMVLGYEYDYTHGNEASTSWGAAGNGFNDVNIAPTSENIHEGTHIIKFDLDAEIKGVTIEDRFRGEFYSLNTHYTNEASFGLVSQNVSQSDRYFQGANTIRLEKQFKDWLFASAGYLYSKLNSQVSFTNVAMSSGIIFLNEVPEITLDRESQVANVNALLGPLDGMTISAGVQGEWTTQHGFGMGHLNQIPNSSFVFNAPATFPIEPTTLIANYDEKSATETIDARYTKIPFTALFVDVRLKQDSIGQSVNDLQSTGNYVENLGFSSELKDIRIGFSTSPWRAVSLTADYRRYENDSHYPTNAPAQPAGGYPGYFRSRELITDEVEAKLVARPCNWFKTTLSYEYLTTDFRDDANPAFDPASQTVFAPGGSSLTGRSDSQIYTISAILTPHPRVYVDASFSYQPSKTTTANSGNPALAPYKGDTYSADVSGTCVLSQTTDFTVSGIFSDADYGQHSTTATVPVDIRYQEYGLVAGLNRRFNKNLSGGLQYSFNYYHEPSSGGANDFRAHTVFATLNYRLP
jgi:hypothetical protein